MNQINTNPTSPSSPTQEQIAARAREIWLTRGQPEGMDLEIWLEAERELSTSRRASTDTTVVEPTGRGVAKTRRGSKSLTEKVDQALSDRPGIGQGGHAKILKQTT